MISLLCLGGTGFPELLINQNQITRRIAPQPAVTVVQTRKGNPIVLHTEYD